MYYAPFLLEHRQRTNLDLVLHDYLFEMKDTEPYVP